MWSRFALRFTEPEDDASADTQTAAGCGRLYEAWIVCWGNKRWLTMTAAWDEQIAPGNGASVRVPQLDRRRGAAVAGSRVRSVLNSY